MIHAITDVRITVAAEPWPMDDDLRARVDAHWRRTVEANPRLWNGRVFGMLAPGRPGGIEIRDGLLTGTAVEGDYAAFLAWRDWGFPEIGIRNLFGSALILSADGALIYGVMGRDTANAGRVYPPGGSLEPRDVTADGRVDVLRSVELELAEETGLLAADAEVIATLAAFEGSRISVARLFRFDRSADDLAAGIRAELDRQAHRELEDVAVIRRPEDLPDAARVPGYARMLAAHVLG